MEQKQILKIVVASPSDVQAERSVLPDIIKELNRGIAKVKGLVLELFMWETDSYPGFHALGPQGLIDSTLKIDNCDVLIGIFWTRFGTPTLGSGSGTEHEFKTAYEAWKKNQRPQIMFYFNEKAHNPTLEEMPQWKKVLEFKRDFPKDGLWHSYKGKAQFEKYIRQHLTTLILQHANQDPPPPPPKNTRRRLPLEPLPVEYVHRRRKYINEDLLKILRKKLSPSSETNLIVLSGPGGVGKTATAQEAVKGLTRRYKDRVVWIGVRTHTSLSFSKVIDEIIRQLEPGSIPPPNLVNRKQEALSQLERDAALVVIDDFETMLPKDQRKFIKFIKTESRATVLLLARPARISREVDHLVFREDIDVMTHSEASVFWRQLVHKAQHRPIFDKPETEIFEKYGTNPFILFVGVFTYVDKEGTWDAVEEMSLGPKTEVERRIFRRSVELPQVGDAGRKVLLALSLFTPHASRESLAYVAGLAPRSDLFRDAVVNLKSLWLINPVGSGVRLTLEKHYRVYAREYMGEFELSKELQGRFIDHFVNYVQAHTSTSADDFKAIEEEKDNILKGLELAYDSGDYSSVMKIFDVLGRPHSGFFLLRGYWDDAINYGDLAVQAATKLSQENEEPKASFACTIASFHVAKGEFDTARKLLRPLVNSGGAGIHRQTYIDALHYMGMVEFAAHDYDKAARLFCREQEESQGAEDSNLNQRGLADYTQELGRIARVQGRFDDARDLYERSREIREQLKNPDGTPDEAAPKSSYHDLGLLAQQEGEYEQAHRHNPSRSQELYALALSYYNKSLLLKTRLDNKSSIAHTLTEMAELARLQAKHESSEEEKFKLYQEARTHLRDSLKIKEELNDQLHLAYSKYILGRVALDEGNIAEAQQHCDEATKVRVAYKDEAGLAGCKYLAGLIAEQEGKLDKAAKLFSAALDIWQSKGLVAAEYARVDLARVSKS